MDTVPSDFIHFCQGLQMEQIFPKEKITNDVLLGFGYLSVKNLPVLF